MADVVIASQQIRIEIRLQVRLKVLTPITGNLVLIGVEQLRQRLLPLPCRIQCAHHLKQRVRFKQIVMVEQSDIFTGRHRKRRIRIPRNARIFTQLLHADTRIFRRILLQKLPEPFLFGAAICKAELPVRVCLCLNRRDHLTQIALRCPIERNCDAERDRIGKFTRPLSLLLLFGRPMPGKPRAIRHLLRLQPV